MLINGKPVQTMFFGGEKWIKGKWVGKEAKLIDSDENRLFWPYPTADAGVNYDVYYYANLDLTIKNQTSPFKILGYLPKFEKLNNQNCYLISGTFYYYDTQLYGNPKTGYESFCIVSENLLEVVGGVIRHTINLLTSIKNRLIHIKGKAVQACI